MKKLLGIHTTWIKLHRIVSRKQLLTYYRMVGWGAFSALLELVGVSVLLHVILSILRPDFIQHNPYTAFIAKWTGVEDQLSFVMLLAVFLFVLYIVKNVIIVQINKAQVKYAYAVTDYLSSRRYKQIAYNDILYFKKRKSAEIVNELFTASLHLPEMIIIPSIILLAELSVMVMLMGAILLYNPMLFVFTFLTLIPAAGMLVLWNKNKLLRYGKEVHEVNPKIYENISQLTQGIANIKLWKGTAYFLNNYNSNRKKAFSLKQSIYVRSQFLPIRIYEVIAILGILIVVFFALVNNKGNASLITYISIYAGLAFRMLPSINRVLASYNSMITNDYALDYFSSDTEPAAAEEEAFEPVNFQTNIVLKDVSFGYTQREEVLEGLNLTLPKGSFTGIVGASGSGKSTLVNIIASLIPVDRGELLVDGKPLSADRIDAYRYLFAYVKQDVFMLNQSIVDNVAFLQDPELIDRNKVEHCLKQVNLWEWVSRLDQGINTQVGELGNNISGGQRQRIAIARALYKNAEIFIFDEATNNLDAQSIEQTMQALQHLKDEGKTVIVITHKAEELALCDAVYDLKKQLTERGV